LLGILISVKDILKLYEKKFGKGDEIWIKTILGDQKTENTKINDLSEINKFKLEILSIFFGKVSLIVAEDFLSTMDTQLREYALKMLVKVTKIKSASLVLFNPSVIYPYVFDKIVILFGNEIVEESTKKEFYHPYSLLLQNTKLTLGKLREKIPIKEIGDPSDHGCPYHPYCDLINKELRKRCYTENPKLFNVRDNKVRCWYYENIK
jgi:ABC-type dipeptide/oligopeptide/nickel transport system ATPase component